jgi:hypothetical protein
MLNEIWCGTHTHTHAVENGICVIFFFSTLLLFYATTTAGPFQQWQKQQKKNYKYNAQKGMNGWLMTHTRTHRLARYNPKRRPAYVFELLYPKSLSINFQFMENWLFIVDPEKGNPQKRTNNNNNNNNDCSISQNQNTTKGKIYSMAQRCGEQKFTAFFLGVCVCVL